MIRKWLAIGIILLYAGLTIAPCVNAYTCTSTSQILSKWIAFQPRFNNDSMSIRFCFVKSGDVQLTNYSGKFYGITMTKPVIYQFGIGSFYIDVIGDNDNDTRLTIFKLFQRDYFSLDVKIYVKLFIGSFQPTGGVSPGILFGFASKITIYMK